MNIDNELRKIDGLFEKICGEPIDKDIKDIMLSYILENSVKDLDIKVLYKKLKRDNNIKKLLS